MTTLGRAAPGVAVALARSRSRLLGRRAVRVGDAGAAAAPTYRGRPRGRRERDRRSLGGFTIDRGASRRVDAYSPARDRWRRLPDLPVGVHHAMAVGRGGKLYVLGGYTVAGAPLRDRVRARARALAGASPHAVPARGCRRGVAGGRIVVAGGIGDGRRLARNALSFDLATRRWSVVAGPTPREHLGVTALAGTVYAVGGRTAGLDTNLLHFESTARAQRSWRRLQPVPDPRGGTGAAALPGSVVSAAARSRAARSPRCSRTGSPSGAGCASTTCRRRGTASGSPRSGVGST